MRRAADAVADLVDAIGAGWMFTSGFAAGMWVATEVMAAALGV